MHKHFIKREVFHNPPGWETLNVSVDEINHGKGASSIPKMKRELH